MEKDENVKENETINESEITIENTEGETSNIQIADDVVAIIAGKLYQMHLEYMQWLVDLLEEFQKF